MSQVLGSGDAFFHLRVNVRERETNVIGGASGAWFCVRFLKEQEPRATEHQVVRRLRDPPPAEILSYQLAVAAGSGAFKWM